ncbi:hypothetical protein JQM66_06165 [Oscillibacter valericigenes]|nr:hypothetical protein [Oscillibacter valericigenes]
MDPLLEMLIVTQNTSDANKEKMQVDTSQNPTVNGGNESGYKPASIGAPTSMVNAVEPAASTYTPKAIEPEAPTGTVTQSGANHKNNMTVRKPQSEGNSMGAQENTAQGVSGANNYRTHQVIKMDLTPAEASLVGPAPTASSETSSPVEGTRPLNAEDISASFQRGTIPPGDG